MARFKVFIRGKHESTGNNMNTNFEISRDSLQEAREDAQGEAKKRYPHYDITVTEVKQL